MASNNPSTPENSEAGGSKAEGRFQKMCRTCVDFQTWMKEKLKERQQKVDGTSTETPQSDPKINAENENNTEIPSRKDCPLDKNGLGNSSWEFLHTMAAHFPEEPTKTEAQNMTKFVELFAQFYPCDYCAADMQEDVKKFPPDATSRKKFGLWMCQMHNRVNKKLGKPDFDCNFIDQRWLKGWDDGSCG